MIAKWPAIACAQVAGASRWAARDTLPDCWQGQRMGLRRLRTTVFSDAMFPDAMKTGPKTDSRTSSKITLGTRKLIWYFTPRTARSDAGR